ncbi:MAG TPA: metallophosphoesterase [Chloroflexia bacterium]|nr:metallophosphoesterase [Chloroflexia bacterium]
MQTEATVPALRPGTRRILAVSDIEEPQLHTSTLADWMGPVDLVISCGDLPAAYLDFLMSMLNAPCYHVIGNHCSAPHGPARNDHCRPEAYPGVVDLNSRTMAVDGLLMAGVEGSPWYNGGPHQYTEQQIALQLWRLVPSLLLNYARTGRYLDILVTHAPPRGIHDATDITHRGFRAFLPFLRRFRPAYMLHGHTHRYISSLPFQTTYAETTIINTYGHRLLEIPADARELRSTRRVGS